MRLQLQYDYVKSSRKVLLDYCRTLPDSDFIKENSSFGRGSARNLLVHIVNTYQFWIGKHSLKIDQQFTDYTSVRTATEVEVLFLSIDTLVEEFLNIFTENLNDELQIILNDKEIVASPLKLFTHVITHEFHHKGQILSLTRHLGYVPIDTDIIR